ncbi:MAG: dihydroorotase [Euryarchaeota archaeon]|nr:dihydroorotase [Euryarchaeota archaeon]
MGDRDLLVRGGRVWTAGGLRDSDILIRGGKIELVGRNLRAPGVPRLGARDRLVLPGAVDLHVHFRDLGQKHKETWAAGSAAALAGGVTSILEMPNTRPPVTTSASFRRKQEAAGRGSRVDYALAGGYTGDNLRGLSALHRAGAMAFGEIFMYEMEPGALQRGLRALRRLGALAILHAEDPGCIACHSAEPTHGERRPEECEARALESICVPQGLRLHVAHTSTPRGVHLARGLGTTLEAAPHHLLLSTRDVARLGPRGHTHPPIRREETRRALWELFCRGRIPILASDHAPHTPAEKRSREPPPGVPGVETMVPLMLEEVHRGRLPLRVLVDAACRRPARLLGLPKGELRPGLDGDLVIYDMHRRTTIRGSRLHSKCGWSPYEGRPGVFPQVVVRRGEIAVREGEVLARPGSGRFLTGGQEIRRLRRGYRFSNPR